MRTAAALVIGNELLSGKITDANVVVLARTLRPLGIRFARVVMILDDVDTIAREVRALASSHDVVFTSGGVGPTHDDLTVASIAQAFDVPMEVAPSMEQMLRDYYGERITEGHLLMARVPKGSRLVTSPDMPWPAVVKENVWILPGIPAIFAAKMPLVREELRGDRPFVSRFVSTTLDEGELKPLLDRVVDAFPDVEIGSYPRWNDADYKTKLTFDGLDAQRVTAARDTFAAGLPGGSIVASDDA